MYAALLSAPRRPGVPMRLAVAQMMPGGEPEGDLHSLLALLAQACSAGASVIVLPAVPSLLADPMARQALEDGVARCGSSAVALAPPGPVARGTVSAQPTPLGRTVFLAGDDAIDPEMHASVLRAAPQAIVLRPDAESGLQAEAILELAVGYSTSLAGLVIVAATAGLDPTGDPFGGSAIVLHGEVLAEAVEPDEVIAADVEVPAILQEPIAPPSQPQVILRQRLAHHAGGKAEVDWLADLD